MTKTKTDQDYLAVAERMLMAWGDYFKREKTGAPEPIRRATSIVGDGSTAANMPTGPAPRVVAYVEDVVKLMPDDYKNVLVCTYVDGDLPSNGAVRCGMGLTTFRNSVTAGVAFLAGAICEGARD